MSTETVEFVVRDCGPVGFLPIIQIVITPPYSKPWVRELYRGEHHKSHNPAIARYDPAIAREAAWQSARDAWENETTSNIKEFKNPPACLEGCP